MYARKEKSLLFDLFEVFDKIENSHKYLFFSVNPSCVPSNISTLLEPESVCCVRGSGRMMGKVFQRHSLTSASSSSGLIASRISITQHECKQARRRIFLTGEGEGVSPFLINVIKFKKKQTYITLTNYQFFFNSDTNVK